MLSKRKLMVFVFLLGAHAMAKEMLVQNVQLTMPAGWMVHQQALDHGTQVLGFQNGERYLNLFVSAEKALSLESLLTTDTRIIRETSLPASSDLQWRMMEVVHEQMHTTLFSAHFKGHFYYGYAHAATAAESNRSVREFIDGMRLPNPKLESLTGPDYTGKKYYLGFGDYLSGSMGNEVKYDVSHTHDMFTKDIGGGYIGSKLVGSGVGEEELQEKWKDLKNKMTDKDMYIQYSSGHGSHSGLMFGPSYNAIRDNALSYPAKEVIIFTMSCYSGNLVNSFNAKKSVWQDWQSKGRTLMVMASSEADDTSSTGPGTDPEEPNGPSGSAGSAFGHALWKAIIGHSDGEIDGVKDGYVSLSELREYTKKKTQSVGSHTPVTTGAYNDNLIMVKVPPKEFVDSLTGGTEGLSDDQILERIRALNQEWSLR